MSIGAGAEKKPPGGSIGGLLAGGGAGATMAGVALWVHVEYVQPDVTELKQKVAVVEERDLGLAKAVANVADTVGHVRTRIRSLEQGKSKHDQQMQDVYRDLRTIDTRLEGAAESLNSRLGELATDVAVMRNTLRTSLQYRQEEAAIRRENGLHPSGAKAEGFPLRIQGRFDQQWLGSAVDRPSKTDKSTTPTEAGDDP